MTESEAPFIYTLLGDGLLRLRDVDQAVDILKEASTLWPDNEQVQLRLGTALAMAGQPAEALADARPVPRRNTPTITSACSWRSGRSTRRAPPASRSSRRTKTAHSSTATRPQYAAAKGPQQAIVDQWKKFMDK